MNTKLGSLALLAAVLLISGCGQKRDLVLPEPAPEAKSPVSTEAPPKDSNKS